MSLIALQLQRASLITMQNNTCLTTILVLSKGTFAKKPKINKFKTIMQCKNNTNAIAIEINKKQKTKTRETIESTQITGTTTGSRYQVQE